MGVLLALRRLGDAEVARFLKDSDPRLVLEAARAINDVPIEGALATLAALPIAPGMPLPLLRRVLNANLRVGGPGQAAAVAEAAGRSDLPSSVPRPGPGDAGKLGQAVGPGRGHGALETDCAAAGWPGRRTRCGRDSRRS